MKQFISAKIPEDAQKGVVRQIKYRAHLEQKKVQVSPEAFKQRDGEEAKSQKSVRLTASVFKRSPRAVTDRTVRARQTLL